MGREESDVPSHVIEEPVFVFRTELRWNDSDTWHRGPSLRFALSRGGDAPIERLAWRTDEGAEAAVVLTPAMENFYGYRQTAGGPAAEYRGELEERTSFPYGAGHRFRTEESQGADWHAAGELRLLLQDGDEVPLERLDWRDAAGGSGSLTLRAVFREADRTGEVTALVGRVRAHNEFRAAGEIADNLLSDSRSKWLGDWQDGAWLEFDLVRPAVVRQYVLVSANDCPDRDPADWTFEGSNDRWEWTPLDTRVRQVFTGRHQARGFSVTGGTGTAYRHYRLTITDNAGAAHAQLSRVRLLEAAPVVAYEGFFGYHQRAGGTPSGYRGAAPAAGTPPRADGPKPPCTVEEWRAYLSDYSADILRVREDGALSEVSDEQRAARWLGYEGASEEKLAALEERLGRRLPPSYRAFLAASDGWLDFSTFMWKMRSTDTVDWISEIEPGLSYSIGGAEEDLVERSLLISEKGDAQYWLLDPEDVSEDGEWAAYIWASWYPGLGERHASFAELAAAERAGFEWLSGYKGRGVRPEGAEDLLAQGRAQALRGEAGQALASFERAVVKGSGVALYLKTILLAFLDLRTANHEIRDNVLGMPHVVAEIGVERLRAEAVPLYLRRMVEEYGPHVGVHRLPVLDELISDLGLDGEPEAGRIERAVAQVVPAMTEPPAFEQALDLARTFAARGDHDGAWSVIVTAMPYWRSDDPHRIAPVVLLTDPALRNVITPHRARLAVTIPRSE